MPFLPGKKHIFYKHGMSDTKTFRAWAGMIQRCTNKNSGQYYDYGGRGIRVSKRWMTFQNFFEDMGTAPNGMSLDRKNVNGNYNKANCRWATKEQQVRNARSNVNIIINGVKKCAAEWARVAGIKKELMIYRYRAGWRGKKLLIPPTTKGNPFPTLPYGGTFKRKPK